MLKCKTMHRNNHLRKLSFNYDYSEQGIPYDVWVNDKNGHIDAIVFLGTVQIGKLARWVAEECPPNTAVVQGAPHWHAKKDGSDIPEYMFGYTKSVFDALAKTFNIQSVNVIADSQAAPGVLQLFAESGYQKFIKKLVLTQPLGLNPSIFRGDDTVRFGTFKRRIIKNAHYQIIPLLLDGKLRYNHHQIIKIVDYHDPVTKAQYNSGLKHDSSADLEILSRLDFETTIVCGSHDKIFPASEIAENLKSHDINIDVREVKGVPHSPLPTRLGKKLLDEAFRILAP